MTDPQPPSEGSRRTMIYKHARRVEGACDSCSKSSMFCEGRQDQKGQHCCPTCHHPS